MHVVEASATVDRTGHRLTVHALNSSVGVPLFLAALELDGTLGDRYSAIVDAENRAHFHDLAPGPYRLIGTHGLTVVDVTVPSDAVEFEALVPDSLKVLSIDKDSLAAAAGLQEGDVVIAVDGSPLSTIEGLKKFGGLASKATAQMTVVRGADLIPLAFVGDASEAAGHGMRVVPWASSVLR